MSFKKLPVYFHVQSRLRRTVLKVTWAVSGDNADCRNWEEGATSKWRVETRGAAQLLTRRGTDPMTVIKTKMSIIASLTNLVLELHNLYGKPESCALGRKKGRSRQPRRTRAPAPRAWARIPDSLTVPARGRPVRTCAGVRRGGAR